MRVPPRVAPSEVERALARITARHQDHDPRGSEMGTDPRSVLEHLRRHSVGLTRDVQSEDVADALVLDAALWWEERERERALLRRARSLGMSLHEIGARMNLASKSAARDHLDRLDALIDLTQPAGFDRAPARGPRARTPPDGITGWAGTAAAVQDAARARRHLARTATCDQAWLDTHGPTVLAVIARLISQLERAVPQAAYGHDSHTTDPVVAGAGTDDDGDIGRSPPTRYGAAARTAHPPVGDPDHDLGEWVDELRRELDTPAPRPATMSVLSLALGELDVHPGARQLDPGHGLHRARRSAHRLRAAYADHSSPRGI